MPITEANDVPPKSGGTSTSTGGKNGNPKPEMKVDKSRSPELRKLEKGLTEFYQTIAISVAAPFDELAGQLIFHRAELLASSWIDVAEENTKVKQTLKRLLEGSGWGAVVMAHVPIALAIAANRGLLADNMANGIAYMTAMQTPETQGLFTNPRFPWNQQTPDPTNPDTPVNDPIV